MELLVSDEVLFGAMGIAGNGGPREVGVKRCCVPAGNLRRIWAHEISFFVRNPELG